MPAARIHEVIAKKINKDYKKRITDSVIFNYKEEDSLLINELESFINDNKKRICDFFNINVENNKPIINIIDKKNKLDDIHRKFNNLKSNVEVPKWLIGLSGPDMQIYQLSINDYDNTSHAFKKEEYEINLLKYKKTMLHEYIHYINRLFCKENNSDFSIKCLREGIAQYLSGQKDNDLLEFNYSLEDILNGNSCYNGWYLVTKYIVENYPHEMFLELSKDKNKAEDFIRNSYIQIKDYYLETKKFMKGTKVII